MNLKSISRNKIVLSGLVGVLCSTVLLFYGKSSYIVRNATISLGLKTPTPQVCQVFWTETKSAPFTQNNSLSATVSPEGVEATFAIPASRVELLRFDFGNGSGPVRAGSISVSERGGSRRLDWRDFTTFHDIGRFDIDGKGAVNVVASGDDPYVVCPIPLGISAATHIALLPLIFLLVLSAILWLPIAGPHGILWNPSPRIDEPLCSKAFAILIAILIFLRFALSLRLPPGFFRSPWDDLWFVNVADSMLKGAWMGTYDQHTLIKGCFGPMVLAVSNILGIPFLLAETVLYVGGCLFFLYVLSRISRNRIFLSLGLILLLFNPLSMAMGTFQRVHRNGMPLWQVPLVFSFLFLLFRDVQQSKKTLLFDSVGAGVALWMFQNTREDGIWAWPFVIVCLTLSVVRVWGNKSSRLECIERSILCVVPIAIFLCGNAAICLINWKVYGLPLRNDRDAGMYAQAMRDIYLIEPDSEDEERLTSPEHAGHYHSIYWSTICQAFDASPTLQTARKGIETAFDAWSRGGHYHGRDLYEDKPLFGLRHGAAIAGYYSSLPKSEAFWSTVHDELNDAFKNGRLRRRGICFTAMCAPLRVENIPHILSEWGKAIQDAAFFHDTASRPTHSDPFWDNMNWNERLHVVSGERFFTEKTVAREQRFIDRCNHVGKIYSIAMPFLVVISLALFVIETIRRLARREWNLTQSSTGAWLFAGGLLASFLLHTACIAYVSATTFWARIGSYMTASYQMELMFVATMGGLYLLRRNEERKGK